MILVSRPQDGSEAGLVRILRIKELCNSGLFRPGLNPGLSFFKGVLKPGRSRAGLCFEVNTIVRLVTYLALCLS